MRHSCAADPTADRPTKRLVVVPAHKPFPSDHTNTTTAKPTTTTKTTPQQHRTFIHRLGVRQAIKAARVGEGMVVSGHTLLDAVWQGQYVMGTAPAISAILAHTPAADLANACLRGAGQVIFMNNPWSGALILVASAVQDPWVMLCGVVGLIASTLTAVLLNLDKNLFRSGLFGYNGLLLGLALGTFLPNWTTLIPCVIFGAFSTIVFVSLGNLLVPTYSVPPLTLPFNLTVFFFLFACFRSSSYEIPFVPAMLAPSDPAHLDGIESISKCVAAVAKSFGQVFLLDNTVSGLLVMMAHLVCSPISFVFALLGVVVGMATAFLLGVDHDLIYDGLLGYNSLLGSTAMVFFFVVSWYVVRTCECHMCMSVCV